MISCSNSSNKKTDGETKEQTEFTGHQYVLSDDTFYPFTFKRMYSETGGNFITKYTIFDQNSSQALMTVTATHYKSQKKVSVSVDYADNRVFAHINDEEVTYTTPDLDKFGYGGPVRAINGNRVPDQLTVKFVDNKFEKIKVCCVMSSAKDNFNSTSFLVLDNKE